MLLLLFRPHVYGAVVYLFSVAAKTEIARLPDRTIGPMR
jgi:hypothetical protein